jgi:hypothetical protein
MIKMCKLILTIALAVMSNGVMAEWTKISSSYNDETTDYVDVATIRKSGHRVKMWSIVDLKIAKTIYGKSYLSSLIQYEYDCKDEQILELHSSALSGNMRNGDVVYSSQSNHEWEPVAPGSIGEVSWKIACGMKL